MPNGGALGAAALRASKLAATLPTSLPPAAFDTGKALAPSIGTLHPEERVRENDQSPDDISTTSYREEQGKEARTDNSAASKPAPSLGALVRGPIGSEAGPNEQSGSPESEADRDAARAREGADLRD